ncbi:MAG: hypothetical protein Kow0059_22210 [Candidatus Sumerlaeia bacterium]
MRRFEFLLLVLLAAGAAVAGDVDLTGRVVPVDWTRFGEAPGFQPSDEPAPLTPAAPRDLVFRFSLDEGAAQKFFALRLESDPSITGGSESAGAPESVGETGWPIWINGRPLEGDPYWFDSVAWYLAAPEFWRAGSNEVRIGGAASTQAAAGQSGVLPWRAQIFSLENAAEEAHFDRFAGGPALFTQPPTHPDQDLMDVLHVDLAITLNMSSATIPAASLTLTARSLAPGGLSQCVLDLNDNGGSLVVSAVDDGSGTPLAFTHSGAQDRVFITLPAPVPQGQTFTVRVFYSGTPVSGQGFRRTTHSGVPLIYTNSQPYRARQWWPCKDIPGDKFTADVRVTCPDTYYNGHPLSVVSNGRLVSVTDNGNGTRTFHWQETYPIASQYISITCTNYQVSADVYTALDGVTTMTVAHHVYPESYASEAGEVVRTIEVAGYFASLFGEYPFLAEKYVTSTWGLSSGMEHQTCTSMPNGNLATPYHRRNVHELAHMWFGTSNGINHFNHLWISEGWASYCEALWKEHKEGTASYFTRMGEYESSASDAFPIVSDSADSFNYGVEYAKGAWVLHMLRHVIGDTAFFAGARSYMEDPALRTGTADSEDVEAHFESAWGHQLDWFFDQWLYRAARPNYQWAWVDYQSGGNTFVALRITQVQGGGVYEMPIDFRATRAGGGTVNFTVWNDASPQDFNINLGPVGDITALAFDPDSWLLDQNTQVFAPVGVTDWTAHE